MKIVAIGGGCVSEGEIDNIFRHIIALSNKENPHILLLPTASFDNISEDDPLLTALTQNGSTVDVLKLTDPALTHEEISRRILSADIVYADGGNLRFLMETWRRTGADKLLLEAGENGTVLSGYSSGAMCWFQSGYDDCGENHEFEIIDCLGLLPYCNCPHFESDYWKGFREAVKTRDTSGIACDDGAALCCVDGNYYTLQGNDGGEVWYFNREKGFPEEPFDTACINGITGELENFLDAEGRLTALPVKRKKLLLALRFFFDKFLRGKAYTESEVNDIIDRHSTFSDPATVRRELCSYRYFTRTVDGTTYRAAEFVQDPVAE